MASRSAKRVPLLSPFILFVAAFLFFFLVAAAAAAMAQ